VVTVMLGTGAAKGSFKWSSCGCADGARTGAGGVTVVTVMLGTGAAKGSFKWSSCGQADGARTGAGGVIAVVPVLGTGAAEGPSSGGAAGARTEAGTSEAIVTIRFGVPVKVDVDTGSGAWGSEAERGWKRKWAWVSSGS
jgi:hypothetical protein